MIEDESFDDLSLELLKSSQFRKSPLGTRIDDATTSPLITQDLLHQKKSQVKKLILEKEDLKHMINKGYITEIASNHLRTVKMPLIRVFHAKNKISRFPDWKSNELSHLPDTNKFIFPDILEVFCSTVESDGWKPETRQQATLTVVQNKLFLVGGVSRSINSDINVFSPVFKKWEKISVTGIEPEPRFGHSAVEYKDSLYIFGGGTHYNSVHKLRECLTGVKILNVDSNELSNLKCNGSYIANRKQHCSAIMGKHMFIHGGFNQKNNLIGDAAVLNLEKNIWKILNIRGTGPGLCGFHSAVAVTATEQGEVNSLFKTAGLRPNAGYTGIYIFGGVSINGQPSDTLHHLKTGSKSLAWSIPETQGQGPCARFQHSMSYNEKFNIIIIFGGRVDIKNSSQYTSFNDIFILNLLNFLWVTVKISGTIPAPRSGHCAASHGSKLYIFGGVNTSTYCSSNLNVIEINPKITKRLVEDQEKKKVKELETENSRNKELIFIPKTVILK
jgi:Kelch motif